MLELMPSRFHLCRGYTFVEMIVVAAILGLVSALVIPKFAASNRRMTVENSLTALRRAFNECAMRSRACGKPLQLLLKTEDRTFTVRDAVNLLDKDWRPPVQTAASAAGEDDEDESPRPSGTGILSEAMEYAVPVEVEWEDLPELAEGEEGYLFTFFPDGEASGPTLTFQLKGERYQIVVDKVTGRGTIVLYEE